MKNIRNKLIPQVTNPFDETARRRLIHMGVTDTNGQVNKDVMLSFAHIFVGLFFDDIYDYYNNTEDLLRIQKIFTGFYEKEDYRKIFLFVSVQYDIIKKPLPDPVWLLAGNEAAVDEFAVRFMACFNELMADFGSILAVIGGDEK